MTHPSIQHAREILSRRADHEARHAQWRADNAERILDDECSVLLQRLADQRQQQAVAEDEAVAEREQWHADVSQWQEARAAQPLSRVVYRDWHAPAERAVDGDDEQQRSLIEVVADVLAAETVRALQEQRREYWQEIDRLRDEIAALRADVGLLQQVKATRGELDASGDPMTSPKSRQDGDG
jgi:hypothetical protein